MAAVGGEVAGSWLLSSGVVSFFIVLLLLSIFLTALCSDCGRHSFEFRDAEVHRNPSTLISVVKLEEVRENPAINEIQNDEKQFHPEENPVQFTPWRSHLGAPQTEQESRPEEASSVQFTSWRNHLVAPQSQDLNSDHIYHTIRGVQGTNGDISSPPPPANHKPTRERDAALEDFSDRDRNSVYAQVSKKLSSNASPPPVYTPEETQVEEEEEEEEEPSPPLPERITEMEG